jgi:hypothetical protein
MAQTKKSNLKDEEQAEIEPENVEEQWPQEIPIGLPDLPGKSRLPEYAVNIPDHPPDEDAPDSMTEAVMENLRIGPGVAEEEESQ